MTANDVGWVILFSLIGHIIIRAAWRHARIDLFFDHGRWHR